MEFALSADQTMMQDSVVKTLDRVCPLDRVKSAVQEKAPYARDVWQSLVELGIPALLIPEAHGGLGLSLLDATLVSEALGRSVAPVPFIASCVMAPIALAEAGNEAQQAHWLPKLASGEAIAGVAIAEQVSGAHNGVGVTASNGKLDGMALFAMDFGAADLFVVADRDRNLHLIDATASGLERIALTTIDGTRSLGELRFSNVDAEPLNAANDAVVLTQMRDAGWVMLAADTLGAGTRMIEKAVDYAKERQQFGRPIGSFQAVKHLCAEMAAELEPCRALVWYAAHAFDGPSPSEASLTAAHAKAHLSEIGRFVARTATEVHGGIGITDLLGLHYWFKRIGLDRQLLGGPERVRHLAAVMQGFAVA
jgi:alkylation response protein AidB-like acyl-CoA dehydrogenase